MHALNGRTSHFRDAGRAPRDAAARQGAFVLPRFLRKPARYAQHLLHGDVVVPRHAGLISTAVFFGLTGLYGAWVGGHMPATIKTTTTAIGLGVNNVKVTGNVRTSDIDVLGALGLDGSTSLVGISAKAAQKAIASLPWVASADVLKIYPDTLSVVIHERKPFAVWQHDGRLSVIDSKGRIIVPFQTGSVDSKLPVVVGQGAATSAAAFVADVRSRPALADRVKDFIRVGDRRWDLELKNGVTVKLPQDGADHAMDEVIALDGRNGLLSRDITTVDMRLDDRVVVRLTQDALERRNADMKALMKSRRRSS